MQEQQKAAVAAERSAEKIRPGREKKKTAVREDKRYTALAKFFQNIEWIFICLAIVVGVALSFIFNDRITTENLGLLFSGMSFRFPGEEAVFETVRFDADMEMDYDVFRDCFAVVTTASLRLYDHRGNIVTEEALKMEDPVLSSGKEYLMVYDKEGTSYVICNALSVVYKSDDVHTLYFAGMNDDGSYYVCCSSEDHPTVIQVYNRSFRLKRELKYDRYPLAGIMSEDGGKMLFLSYRSGKNGQLEGYVNIYDMTGETVVLLEQAYDELPLDGVFLVDGGMAVVFESGIRFYDEQGTETVFLSFPYSAPVKLAMSAQMIAVSFDENKVHGTSNIVLYDTKEKRLFDTVKHVGRIERLYVSSERLFITEEEKTSIYDSKTMKTMILDLPFPDKLIFTEEKDVLFFCYGNKAENKAQEINKYFND